MINEKLHKQKVPSHILESSTAAKFVIPVDPSQSNQIIIGILLALVSNVFIGSSFILKKKGLLRLTMYNEVIRAGSGGFGYLREFLWWVGLITMGFGELCNFAAYGFAPASVVTPLGALSVLISTLLAIRLLDEKLTMLGKIGCFLTVFGSIVIIIHSPKESELTSLVEFARKISTSEFLFFSLMTSCSVFCLMVYYGPRSGAKNILVYILICSLLGAFTVTACKGLGLGLKEILNHEYTYSKWLTLSCAMTIAFCVLIQMVYLNRALDLFPTPVVTTVYYVLFTTCVLITSGILFHEWYKLTVTDVVACIIGFLLISCGLVLINYVKISSPANNILFQYFPANLTSSTFVRQQDNLQVKSYDNLLVDVGDFASINNSLKE